MDKAVLLMVIEVVIGIVVEGIILSMVFAYISNQTSEKQNNALKNEMSNIETQNKFQLEQILKSLQEAKTEVISQIKESQEHSEGGK